MTFGEEMFYFFLKNICDFSKEGITFFLKKDHDFGACKKLTIFEKNLVLCLEDP